ncbi:6,7-dimethyl-8-ribityllumazine synthase [Albimonas donghaensis]|uniref:6,7-dimethyl-8-ribityllumazine synthase n=1 Tax=Albimonas donghaensis TaxID=356660 RepID=A0A1H3A2Z5_9RHOB|nr:6,7-dimethyl-8-ribityllumazine synthase [Albimonas donghaensis]SDX23995.1 6,7-dimethyl-8-ribityllumazine synthase [Albimonas donghaensis]
MASTDQDGTLPAPSFEGRAPHVLLVAAPFYRKVADGMIAGARAALEAAGATHELIEVPGALEIPAAIRLAHARGGYEGFVALGCVIRGETYHFELVCNESGRGLTLLGLEGIAIGNGVLTTEDLAQAEVRADPARMNKGGGAAEAALHLIALARRFAA